MPFGRALWARALGVCSGRSLQARAPGARSGRALRARPPGVHARLEGALLSTWLKNLLSCYRRGRPRRRTKKELGKTAYRLS